MSTEIGLGITALDEVNRQLASNDELMLYKEHGGITLYKNKNSDIVCSESTTRLSNTVFKLITLSELKSVKGCIYEIFNPLSPIKVKPGVNCLTGDIKISENENIEQLLLSFDISSYENFKPALIDPIITLVYSTSKNQTTKEPIKVSVTKALSILNSEIMKPVYKTGELKDLTIHELYINPPVANNKVSFLLFNICGIIQIKKGV